MSQLLKHKLRKMFSGNLRLQRWQVIFHLAFNKKIFQIFLLFEIWSHIRSINKDKMLQSFFTVQPQSMISTGKFLSNRFKGAKTLRSTKSKLRQKKLPFPWLSLTYKPSRKFASMHHESSKLHCKATCRSETLIWLTCVHWLKVVFDSLLSTYN